MGATNIIVDDTLNITRVRDDEDFLRGPVKKDRFAALRPCRVENGSDYKQYAQHSIRVRERQVQSCLLWRVVEKMTVCEVWRELGKEQKRGYS